jgi:hypothetical protein
VRASECERRGGLRQGRIGVWGASLRSTSIAAVPGEPRGAGAQ